MAMRKMYRRKMRGRKLTRSVIRLRKKGVFVPRGRVRARRGTSRPEVKFMDITVSEQALNTVYANPASANLVNSATSHLLRIDALKSIAQGTASYQRVGSKIFVKTIQFKSSWYLCPIGGSTDLYSHCQARFIVGDWAPANTATDLNAFFGINSTRKMFAPLNRKLYNIYYDKIHTWSASWAIDRSANSTASLCGSQRMVNFNIPVNRYVTFSQDGDVKEDYNVYSFAALCQLPNKDSNSTQALCGGYNIRIYFTDV